MIQPINVTLNYGRLSDEAYTHIVDGGPVTFGWGALSDGGSDVQTSRRLTLTAEDFFGTAVGRKAQNLRFGTRARCLRPRGSISALPSATAQAGKASHTGHTW